MRNQAVVLTIGISLLVFGVIVWFITAIYLPGERKKLEQYYASQYATEKVFMVDNDDGIYSNTTITDDLFNQKSIIPVDVPKNFLPKDKTGSLLVYTEGEKESMLKNRTNRKLNKGEYILKKVLDNTPYPDNEQFKRRAEYTFKNSVSGELKTGSLVDVILDYQNGDYDIVISKIKIDKIIPSADQAAAQANGQPVPQGDGTAQVILSLDEVQYRDMELAKKLGSLRVRLYNDEEQLPSLETFKYAEMKNTAINIARANGLVGEIANYGASAFIGFLGDKSDIAEKLNARLQYYKEQKELQKLQEQMQASGQASGQTAQPTGNTVTNTTTTTTTPGTVQGTTQATTPVDQ